MYVCTYTTPQLSLVIHFIHSFIHLIAHHYPHGWMNEMRSSTVPVLLYTIAIIIKVDGTRAHIFSSVILSNPFSGLILFILVIFIYFIVRQ